MRSPDKGRGCIRAEGPSASRPQGRGWRSAVKRDRHVVTRILRSGCETGPPARGASRRSTAVSFRLRPRFSLRVAAHPSAGFRQGLHRGGAPKPPARRAANPSRRNRIPLRFKTPLEKRPSVSGMWTIFLMDLSLSRVRSNFRTCFVPSETIPPEFQRVLLFACSRGQERHDP